MDEQAEYEKKHKVIVDMFPDAKFYICHDLEQLDKAPYGLEDIIDKKEIILYLNPTKKIKIKCDKMTVKNIINELIKINYTPYGDHIFLEGFVKKGNNTYGMYFGS